MKKLYVVCALFAVCMLTGCDMDKMIHKKDDTVEKKDIEYTVVEDADVPPEFLEIINEKKEDKFQTTFSDKEFLYIGVGYGQQPTSGYCISVEDIWQTDDSIDVTLGFDGPDSNEQIIEEFTYPYIVLKVENTEKQVNIY